MKYIAVFFIATGIAFNIVRKKQLKGEETWEGKHGIDVKAWWCPACISVGIFITFLSNALQNIEEFDINGIEGILFAIRLIGFSVLTLCIFTLFMPKKENGKRRFPLALSIIGIILGLIFTFGYINIDVNGKQVVHQDAIINTEEPVSEETIEGMQGTEGIDWYVDSNGEAHYYTGHTPNEQLADNTKGNKERLNKQIQEQNNTVEDKQEIDSTNTGLVVGGVPITLPEEFVNYQPYYSESYASFHPDSTLEVSYADSFIDVGDKDAIENERQLIDNTYNCKSELLTLDMNGDTWYLIGWVSDTANYVMIYEVVPNGKTYLEVKVEDYTGKRDLNTMANDWSLKLS